MPVHSNLLSETEAARIVKSLEASYRLEHLKINANPSSRAQVNQNMTAGSMLPEVKDILAVVDTNKEVTTFEVVEIRGEEATLAEEV